MKALLVVAAVAAMQTVPVAPPVAGPKPQQLAMLCFSTGERQSGMNKICYYDCAGSSAAITVSSTELCPLSINQ